MIHLKCLNEGLRRAWIRGIRWGGGHQSHLFSPFAWLISRGLCKSCLSVDSSQLVFELVMFTSLSSLSFRHYFCSVFRVCTISDMSLEMSSQVGSLRELSTAAWQRALIRLEVYLWVRVFLHVCYNGSACELYEQIFIHNQATRTRRVCHLNAPNNGLSGVLLCRKTCGSVHMSKALIFMCLGEMTKNEVNQLDPFFS